MRQFRVPAGHGGGPHRLERQHGLPGPDVGHEVPVGVGPARLHGDAHGLGGAADGGHGHGGPQRPQQIPPPEIPDRVGRGLPAQRLPVTHRHPPRTRPRRPARG
ncbi:hypothetical protein ACFQ60_30415 [Streptomyces zhihengii]